MGWLGRGSRVAASLFGGAAAIVHAVEAAVEARGMRRARVHGARTRSTGGEVRGEYAERAWGLFGAVVERAMGEGGVEGGASAI